MSILASNEPFNLFRASGQGHPTWLAAEDAEALTVPHLILASKDENQDDVKAFGAVEKPAGSETHLYPTMIHGWMGARAALDDEECAKEFKRA